MPAGGRDNVDRLNRKSAGRGLALSILLSLGALSVVFLLVPDREAALRSLRTFDPGKLGTCAALMAGAWFSDSCRLYLLTHGVGKPVPLRTAVKAVLAGNFLTLVTPFLAGGAPVVAYTVKRGRMRWGEATAVVVGGGIVAQAALVILAIWAAAALEALGFKTGWERVFRFVVPAYALGLAGFSALALRADVVEDWVKAVVKRCGRRTLAVVSGKFIRILRDFAGSLRLLASENVAHVVGALAFGLAYFVLLFAIGPVVLSGLGVEYAWREVFALQILVYVFTGVTPTPGGSGTAELGTFVVFSHLAPIHTIGAFLVVWRLCTFYFSLLTGGVAFAIVLRDILSES
ncbi:MAG: flippase-like domain-containing protein [Firmicutes bacterium]|nr:flippase-like domain-containing protein [Bacillota bacterium]